MRMSDIDHDNLPQYRKDLRSAAIQFLKHRSYTEDEVSAMMEIIDISRKYDHELLLDMSRPRFIVRHGTFARNSALHAYENPPDGCELRNLNVSVTVPSCLLSTRTSPVLPKSTFGLF